MAVIVTLVRERCIGCNVCEEVAPEHWRMSKKDGKTVLLGAKEKKGFFTKRVDDSEFECNNKAAQDCPVKIIKVTSI